MSWENTLEEASSLRSCVMIRTALDSKVQTQARMIVGKDIPEADRRAVLQLRLMVVQLIEPATEETR